MSISTAAVSGHTEKRFSFVLELDWVQLLILLPEVKNLNFGNALTESGYDDIIDVPEVKQNCIKRSSGQAWKN